MFDFVLLVLVIVIFSFLGWVAREGRGPYRSLVGYGIFGLVIHVVIPLYGWGLYIARVEKKPMSLPRRGGIGGGGAEYGTVMYDVIFTVNILILGVSILGLLWFWRSAIRKCKFLRATKHVD